MTEQILALGALIVVGGLVVHFLCELLLAWASSALVDANPSLGRLCLFVLAAIAATGGAYFVVSLLIDAVTQDWATAAGAERKSPWSLYALHYALFMLCSLLVVGALAGPVLGLSPKQSVLVGVFVVLLRMLLWSLIYGVVFVVFGYIQGYRGTTPKATGKSAQVMVAAPARA